MSRKISVTTRLFIINTIIMSFGNVVQKFLKGKLEETNLKAKIFAQESKIPYPTVNKIINSIQLNPDLKNILKIANYFNCSIEEVLQRNNIPKDVVINNLSFDLVNSNLRNFLKKKIKKHLINPYQLSKDCGFSSDAIRPFIRENNPQKTLGILVIVALADYFKIPIDVMIGRISSSNQEPQILEKVEPKIE